MSRGALSQPNSGVDQDAAFTWRAWRRGHAAFGARSLGHSLEQGRGGLRRACLCDEFKGCE
jgi:hypothetical protein